MYFMWIPATESVAFAAAWIPAESTLSIRGVWPTGTNVPSRVQGGPDAVPERRSTAAAASTGTFDIPLAGRSWASAGTHAIRAVTASRSRWAIAMRTRDRSLMDKPLSLPAGLVTSLGASRRQSHGRTRKRDDALKRGTASQGSCGRAGAIPRRWPGTKRCCNARGAGPIEIETLPVSRAPPSRRAILVR